MSPNKQKLVTSEICREYYETIVFEEDKYFYFLVEAYNTVLFFDESFKNVDENQFCNEITALHIELFGMAWLDLLGKIAEENERRVPVNTEEIVFTKKYLLEETNKESDIWGKMGIYNEAIISSRYRSIIFESILNGMKVLSNVEKGSYEERIAKAKLDSLQSKNMMKEFVSKHLSDSECLDRYLNRWEAYPWNVEMMTNLSQEFAITLTESLGCKLNTSAMFAIQSIIAGLYGFAQQQLRLVEGFGSLGNADKENIKFREGFMKWVNLLRKNGKL